MSDEIKKPYISSIINHKNHDRILDVGCCPGGLGGHLRSNGYTGILTGIDLKELPEAAIPFYDKFIKHDIELWSGDLVFDAIVCSEIIQYMRDPWAVVKKLVSYLKPGGTFYMSIPNVSNYEFISNFILGTGEYGKGGDRFHRDVLRWFNRTSAQNLMLGASLSVDECIDVFSNDTDKQKIVIDSKEMMAVSNRESGNRLMVPADQVANVIVSHYVLVGRRF